MEARSEASVTWPQALAWRMGRQLLDPVGTESVAGVVRRLGAVPAMDESLAELAVRTRRTTSRPGELAQALADGEVVKAFAFRGPCTTSRPRTAAPTSRCAPPGGSGSCRAGWSTTGSRPQDWPAFRAAVREALARRAADRRRAGRGA